MDKGIPLYILENIRGLSLDQIRDIQQSVKNPNIMKRNRLIAAKRIIDSALLLASTALDRELTREEREYLLGNA